MKHYTLHTLLVGILLVLAAGTLIGKPPKEKLKPLRKYLDKKISCTFMEVPFERTIEYIKREAGIPLVIDNPYPIVDDMGTPMPTPITLRVKDMKVESLLNWICRLSGLDYDVIKGEIIFTTPEKAIAPYLEMRVYDVRALSLTPRDFPARNRYIMRYEGGYGLNPLGHDTGIDVDLLKSLIEMKIPGEWSGDNKDIGIDVSNGLLMITQTAEVHKKIETFLKEFRKVSSAMVSFTGEFARVEPEVLDKILNQSETGSCILNPKELAVLKKQIRRVPRTEGMARTVCFNFQRVHVATDSQKEFVRDVTPVVATLTGGLDPEIDTTSDGLTLDVVPAISFDGTKINIAVKGTAVVMRKETKVEIPMPGGPAVVLPGQTEQTVGQNNSMPITLPENDVIRFNTMARIPDGGALVLTGRTVEYIDGESRDLETVLLLKAKVVR